MRFSKPELVPLLFIIGATALLLSLGLWQVERLRWKNAVLAATQEAQALPALGALPQTLAGLEYRNVLLTGIFLHDKTMHMVGKPRGAGQGFYIVTPLKLDDDGRIVLVNRGFAPPGRETRPEGMQSVQGILRPLRQKRLFSPDNQPQKNVWFYEDIPAMSQATGLDILPIMVEEVGPAAKGVYPAPGDGKITMRNDHLHYAITWFSLAVIGLVMFAFYHRIPDPRP